MNRCLTKRPAWQPRQQYQRVNFKMEGDCSKLLREVQLEARGLKAIHAQHIS